MNRPTLLTLLLMAVLLSACADTAGQSPPGDVSTDPTVESTPESADTETTTPVEETLARIEPLGQVAEVYEDHVLALVPQVAVDEQTRGVLVDAIRRSTGDADSQLARGVEAVDLENSFIVILHDDICMVDSVAAVVTPGRVVLELQENQNVLCDAETPTSWVFEVPWSATGPDVILDNGAEIRGREVVTPARRPGDSLLVGDVVAEIRSSRDVPSVVVADTETRRADLIEVLGNAPVSSGAEAAEALEEQLAAIRQPDLSQVAIVAFTQDVCAVLGTYVTSPVPGALDFEVVHDGSVDCVTRIPVTWIYALPSDLLDVPSTTIDGASLDEALSVPLTG